MNTARNIAIAGIGCCVLICGMRLASAAQVVVDRGPTSNAIPMSAFDQGLGKLVQVDVAITLEAGTTFAGGAHSHTLSSAVHLGGTTGSGGSHSHTILVPQFSGGGVSLFPAAAFQTDTVASHVHTAGAFASTTNSVGSHTHSYPSQTTDHPSQHFGLGELAPFLAPTDFSLTGPLFQTQSAGAHTHSFGLLTALSAGSHAHDFTDTWSTSTTFTFIALEGDVSADDTVDIGDFTLWADAFGNTGSGLPADISDDGQVDIADFTLWGDNFGAVLGADGGGGVTAVPEPTSFVMATAGLVALVGCGWRRRRRKK